MKSEYKNKNRNSFSGIEFDNAICNDSSLADIKNDFKEVTERRMLSLDMQKTVITGRSIAKMFTTFYSDHSSEHLSFFNSVGLFEHNIDLWFPKHFAQKIVYSFHEFQKTTRTFNLTYLLPLNTQNYQGVYQNDTLCWKIVIQFNQNKKNNNFSRGELVTAYIVNKGLRNHDKKKHVRTWRKPFSVHRGEIYS